MDQSLLFIASVALSIWQYRKNKTKCTKIDLYGGCHCGKVRFKFKAHNHLTVWTCTCSICVMKRNDHIIIPNTDFSLLTNPSFISEYRFNSKKAIHKFCKVCGVQSFYVPRSNQDGVGITKTCIEESSMLACTFESKVFDGKDWETFYAGKGAAIKAFSKT
jgi:hypothetical protein